MRVSPEVLDSPDEIGRTTARVIADGIAAAVASGDRFVLGCPSGRSAQTTYEHLAGEVARRGLDLSAVVIALMDEYLVPEQGGLRAVPVSAAHSCVGFGMRHILEPLSAAAGAGRSIPTENLWYPEAEHAAAYDVRLEAAGGIDIFLLASGASDGHIALNPVGSSVHSRSRVVELGERTRHDNLATFPSLLSVEEVPHFGVTVGVGTIRDLSKSVIMLAHGADKSEAVRRIETAEHYDADWPATILSECASPRFLIDREASRQHQPAA